MVDKNESALMEDNEETIEKIKKHNIFAVTEWIEGRKDKLYRIVQEYGSGSAQEEAIEKAVIRIYQNIKELKDVKLFEPWAMSIILDECRKISSPQKEKAVLGEDEASCDRDISPVTELKRLNGVEKDSVVLKYYGGYSIDDISKIMNITPDEVRHEIYLGLKEISPA